MNQGQGRAETALRLTKNALAGYLASYQSVPMLLAEVDAVRDLAAHPDDPARPRSINWLLEQRNALLGSSDICIMCTDGLTIAASNHTAPIALFGRCLITGRISAIR